MIDLIVKSNICIGPKFILHGNVKMIDNLGPLQMTDLIRKSDICIGPKF